MSQNVKPTLQKQVCATVGKMIDEDANEMLATLPLKIPLSATKVNPSADEQRRATTRSSSRSTVRASTTSRTSSTSRGSRGKRQVFLSIIPQF